MRTIQLPKYNSASQSAILTVERWEEISEGGIRRNVKSVKGILKHQNILVEDCTEVERINASVEDTVRDKRWEQAEGWLRKIKRKKKVKKEILEDMSKIKRRNRQTVKSRSG